jgi:hypothetical protein
MSPPRGFVPAVRCSPIDGSAYVLGAETDKPNDLGGKVHVRLLRVIPRQDGGEPDLEPVRLEEWIQVANLLKAKTGECLPVSIRPPHGVLGRFGDGH